MLLALNYSSCDLYILHKPTHSIEQIDFGGPFTSSVGSTKVGANMMTATQIS